MPLKAGHLDPWLTSSEDPKSRKLLPQSSHLSTVPGHKGHRASIIHSILESHSHTVPTPGPGCLALEETGPVQVPVLGSSPCDVKPVPLSGLNVPTCKTEMLAATPVP